MANYKCEEMSECENFQSAICLHCNHRLCLQHIAEHNIIVFGGVGNLLNEVEITFQKINEESEKNRTIYNNVLVSCNEWRIQQMEKIQQVYENHLQLIKSQQESLNQVQQKLFEQLNREARQPLEHIQTQQSANAEVLNHIRQTIKNIREHSVQLKEIFTIPLSNNTEYFSSDSLPILPGTGNMKSIPGKTTSLPSTNIIKLRIGRPKRRLVRLFSSLSSIEKSKNVIETCIKSHGRNFGVSTFICSYLTAWSETQRTADKVFLLNEHISTVRKHLNKRKTDFDVLIGIQIFFHKTAIHVNKNEMMEFLLQFFLNHQCITQKLLFDWYINNDAHGFMGYQKAKQLAKPFIEILANKVGIEVDNTQAVSMTVDKCDTVEIKQETVVSA